MPQSTRVAAGAAPCVTAATAATRRLSGRSDPATHRTRSVRSSSAPATPNKFLVHSTPSPSLKNPLLTALLLAGASCGAHALLAPQTGNAFAAVLLGALGGVYLGGALRAGTKPEIVVTILAAVLCIFLAVAGLLGPAWIIPAGFLLHGVWDWVHHAMGRRTVGQWWPPFCAVYDLIVGLYLVVAPHLRN